MREIHQRQWQLGPVALDKLEFESDCRADTTAILRCWQHLFCPPEVYAQVLRLLEQHLLAELNTVLVQAGHTWLGLARVAGLVRGRDRRALSDRRGAAVGCPALPAAAGGAGEQRVAG